MEAGEDFMGRGDSGDWERGQRQNQPPQLIKETRYLIQRRFHLCQNSLENFKHGNFLDMNKFVAATNHKDVVYLVQFSEWTFSFTLKFSLSFML